MCNVLLTALYCLHCEFVGFFIRFGLKTNVIYIQNSVKENNTRESMCLVYLSASWPKCLFLYTRQLHCNWYFNFDSSYAMQLQKSPSKSFSTWIRSVCFDAAQHTHTHSSYANIFFSDTDAIRCCRISKSSYAQRQNGFHRSEWSERVYATGTVQNANETSRWMWFVFVDPLIDC